MQNPGAAPVAVRIPKQHLNIGVPGILFDSDDANHLDLKAYGLVRLAGRRAGKSIPVVSWGIDVYDSNVVNIVQLPTDQGTFSIEPESLVFSARFGEQHPHDWLSDVQFQRRAVVYVGPVRDLISPSSAQVAQHAAERCWIGLVPLLIPQPAAQQGEVITSRQAVK